MESITLPVPLRLCCARGRARCRASLLASAAEVGTANGRAEFESSHSPSGAFREASCSRLSGTCSTV
jgi:hypothetical protein